MNTHSGCWVCRYPGWHEKLPSITSAAAKAGPVVLKSAFTHYISSASNLPWRIKITRSRTQYTQSQLQSPRHCQKRSKRQSCHLASPPEDKLGLTYLRALQLPEGLQLSWDTGSTQTPHSPSQSQYSAKTGGYVALKARAAAVRAHLPCSNRYHA